MATAGIILTADIQNLTELQEALRKALPPEAKAEILRAAMEKAIEPLFNRLKAVTPVGPTGNLRRAAAKKVVAYPKSGNCVGLVGYKRAGSGRSRSAQGGRVRTGRDRAFHQYWLEEGTLPRLVTTYSNTTYGRRGHLRRLPGRPAVEVRPHMVKGQNAYIASSFSKLGPFKFVPTPRPPKGEEGHRVETEPGYPQAYFKKSKTPIQIPPMLPGGKGQPPIKTAWNDTKSVVAEILSRELRISLEQAFQTLVRTSTGTL